jgi:hypothetical protein
VKKTGRDSNKVLADGSRLLEVLDAILADQVLADAVDRFTRELCTMICLLKEAQHLVLNESVLVACSIRKQE